MEKYDKYSYTQCYPHYPQIGKVDNVDNIRVFKKTTKIDKSRIYQIFFLKKSNKKEK